MQEVHDAWYKIIARAWSDDAYKQELLDDPKAALQEMGVDTIGGQPVTLAGFNIKVVEDPNATAGDWHIVGKGMDATCVVALPPRPSASMSESELESVAGAGCCCSSSCCCCGTSTSEI
jgi:hypothetical protein